MNDHMYFGIKGITTQQTKNKTYTCTIQNCCYLLSEVMTFLSAADINEGKQTWLIQIDFLMSKTLIGAVFGLTFSLTSIPRQQKKKDI